MFFVLDLFYTIIQTKKALIEAVPDDHEHEHGDAHAHAEAHDHGHDAHAHEPHESPWVVTLPLILLAIPSVLIGYFTIEPLLYGDFFKDAVFINFEHHPAMEELAHEFHGALAMAVHGLSSLPFWLASSGVVVAFVFYRLKPEIPAAIGRALSPLVNVLENKYYMDWFNEHVLAAGARLLGRGLWKGGDVSFIDGALVNGSARLVGSFSSVVRLVQTGYLYWYALVMILGLIGLMTWQLWPYLGSAVGR